MSELVSHVDVERIRATRFRMALDYGYSGAAISMPALLRSLRVESFSTHSVIDPDEQAILAADLPAFTTQTTRLVEAMGAHLGVVFDRSAERIVLIDEQAREIPPDTALHLLIGLVAKHRAGEGRIVIPANVSRVAERIAGAYGVPIERAGITQAGLIAAAAADGVMFAGAPDGGYVFPEFQPGFDAIMSVAKVLELLALEHKPLSELRAEVPTSALIHQRAPVPVEPQGARDARAERARHRPARPAGGRHPGRGERRLGAARARPRRAAVPHLRRGRDRRRVGGARPPLPDAAGRGAGHRRPMRRASALDSVHTLNL